MIPPVPEAQGGSIGPWCPTNTQNTPLSIPDAFGVLLWALHARAVPCGFCTKRFIWSVLYRNRLSCGRRNPRRQRACVRDFKTRIADRKRERPRRNVLVFYTTSEGYLVSRYRRRCRCRCFGAAAPPVSRARGAAAGHGVHRRTAKWVHG